MNSYANLLFLVAVIAGIRSGAGIFCYVCVSGDNYDGNRCEHIPEDGSGREDFKKNCSSLSNELGWPERNYTLCRKFVQDVDGEYRVVRSCATDGRVGQCVDRTGTAKIKLRYCECENESPDVPCNGTPPSAPTYLRIGVLAAFFIGFALAAVRV